ncbi:MAG TPA: helix-turn-helix transcriptional regulator [Pseudogracilibacillus sp.]|nr:helix-turn-helix transcriptional regulator [Pseudogracilibacillus sp.]
MENNYGTIEDERCVTDSSLLYDLSQTFYTYEEKIVTHLQKGELKDIESILLDFCLKTLQLPEEHSVFITRLFFSSLITNIIRKQNKRGVLPSNALARGYELIRELEQWKSISEYMLHIPNFVETLKHDITLDHLLFKGDPLIEEALAIIYHNLRSKDLSVNAVAKKLDVSTTHLSNLFKKHLSITPSDYITQEKISAIIHDLKHSSDSLHTIRKRFGFQNHSHFIQFFKKSTNLTPLQYIQQHVY